MNHQILSIALIFSLLLSSTDAFSPSMYTSTTTTGSTATRPDMLIVQNAKRVNYDDPEDVVGMTSRTMKEFLLCTATAVVFAVAPALPASASSYSDIDRLPTIHIADNVKELDFSLPSYEDIKSYKASAENAKSLTVQPKPFDPKSISLRTSSSLVQSNDASTTSTPSDDTTPTTTTTSNPLGSFLPSMSKKGPKQKASYDGYTF